MSEWKETTLGDVANDISYGYTESASHKSVGPKFLRITDIQDDFIDWKDVPYCPINKKDYKKYKLDIGDICIARTGNSTGTTAIIKEDVGAVFASYLIRFRINKEIANPFYIGFLLKSYYWKGFVKSIIGGSAQPGANAQMLSGFPIKLPPLIEQIAISDIFTSIDSKIDLLRRQNLTLENIAQTLFKRWFIDYEFPSEDAKPYKSNGGKMVNCELDKMPMNWKVGKINDLCQKLASGGTPSTKNSKYYSGRIDWFSTKELKDNYLFESEKKITEEALNNSSAKLFPRGAVVMAIYAAPTVGRLGILAGESTFNQAACGFVADENICCNEFIYLFLLHSRNILNNLANGAAQQNLNVGIVSNFPVIIPDKIVMKKFIGLIKPIFNKIYINSHQIQTLTKTRGTLLPKLMSGQIRVKDL